MRLAGSARNGAARWWGGEGGKGGEGGAATEHYSSLSFQEELLVVGGKENMWAVRAVGWKHAGGCSGGGVGSVGSGEGTVWGGVGCVGGVGGGR